jgi:hypothetical protein
MKDTRRILKTGALAVVVTIAFASFAFRVEEWTKALRSDFVVLGQTGGGSTGGSTGTTGGGATFTVTKILPQIAVGSFDGNLSKYSTTIQIVNTGTSAVTVKGNFYKQADGSPSDLTYTTNLSGVSVTAGVLNETSLPANSSLVITGSLPTTTPAVYKGNWARLQATGSVTIVSFFEIRDGATNVLASRVGVSASPVMSKFAVPRVRNVAAGLDVGYAIANMGETPINVTATLRDATGAQIGASKIISLGARSQKADFFGTLFGLTETGAAPAYSYVTFDGGSSAQLGSIAVSFEGATQTSFPVDQLQ